MTLAEAKDLVAAAVTSAQAVANNANDGVYLTRGQADAAIAEARSAIQDAIEAVIQAASSTSAYPVVTKLRVLAAALLGLGNSLAEDLEVEVITLRSERSILDIARERYATAANPDVLGWAEKLHALNPRLPNPLRIAPGTEVSVYVP